MPDSEHKSYTFHPIAPADKDAMAAMRALVLPNKGRFAGTAAREPFAAIMERVAVPDGVTFEQDTVGGVAGWWCQPKEALAKSALLHIHGGWFHWGTAKAFRNLVGHLALRAGVAAFIPEYRLAPEHPFPAACDDVRTCYAGLLRRGDTRIAVSGDSAGGNLALGLLASLAAAKVTPVAGVAISPVTDLTLQADSWQTRAQADPLFIKSQAGELVRTYLNGHAADDARASPLYAKLAGLPPLAIHVGDDEVLLDDSKRLRTRAEAAGVMVTLDVWEGMVHGFLGSVGRLQASAEALEHIGVFLRGRFAAVAT